MWRRLKSVGIAMLLGAGIAELAALAFTGWRLAFGSGLPVELTAELVIAGLAGANAGFFFSGALFLGSRLVRRIGLSIPLATGLGGASAFLGTVLAAGAVMGFDILPHVDMPYLLSIVLPPGLIAGGLVGVAANRGGEEPRIESSEELPFLEDRP